MLTSGDKNPRDCAIAGTTQHFSSGFKFSAAHNIHTTLGFCYYEISTNDVLLSTANKKDLLYETLISLVHCSVILILQIS